MISVTSNYSPYRVGYSNQPINNNKIASSNQSSTSTESDSVSFSQEALAMTQSAGQASSAETAGTSLHEIGADLLDHFIFMINNLDEITAEFKDDLQSQLRNEGIDCDQPFKLTVAYDGKVVVSGDHPDKAKIEKYFEDNPEMRDRFADISVHTVLKRHLEAHMEFAEAYEKDPEAAVARYFPIFATIKREGFTMSLGGDAESGSGQA